MAQADGNGEFRAQAQALAGLALGHENTAAQVLAGHIEERLGRLDDRRIDAQGAQPLEIREKISGKGWKVDQGHGTLAKKVGAEMPLPNPPHKGEGVNLPNRPFSRFKTLRVALRQIWSSFTLDGCPASVVVTDPARRTRNHSLPLVGRVGEGSDHRHDLKHLSCAPGLPPARPAFRAPWRRGPSPVPRPGRRGLRAMPCCPRSRPTGACPRSGP